MAVIITMSMSATISMSVTVIISVDSTVPTVHVPTIIVL